MAQPPAVGGPRCSARQAGMGMSTRGSGSGTHGSHALPSLPPASQGSSSAKLARATVPKSCLRAHLHTAQATLKLGAHLSGTPASLPAVHNTDLLAWPATPQQWTLSPLGLPQSSHLVSIPGHSLHSPTDQLIFYRCLVSSSVLSLGLATTRGHGPLVPAAHPQAFVTFLSPGSDTYGFLLAVIYVKDPF